MASPEALSTMRSNPKIVKPKVSRIRSAAIFAAFSEKDGAGEDSFAVPAFAVDGIGKGAGMRSKRISTAGDGGDALVASPGFRFARGVRDRSRVLVVASLIDPIYPRGGRGKGRKGNREIRR